MKKEEKKKSKKEAGKQIKQVKVIEQKVIVHKPWRVHQAELNKKRKIRNIIIVCFFSLILLTLGFTYLPLVYPIIALGVALFFILRGIILKIRGKKHRSRKKGKGSRFVREYLAWFIAFTIGIIIAHLIEVNYVSIKVIWVVILNGVLIECCSKIMQIFVLKRPWIVDEHFLSWVVIQIGTFFITYNIFNLLLMSKDVFSELVNTNSPAFVYSILVLMGVVQTLFIHVVWKYRKNIV